MYEEVSSSLTMHIKARILDEDLIEYGSATLVACVYATLGAQLRLCVLTFCIVAFELMPAPGFAWTMVQIL
jgi:hypothetical protein